MFGVLLSSIALAAPITVNVGTDVANPADCNLREAIACLNAGAGCAALANGCAYGGNNTIDIGVASVVLQSPLDVDTAVLGQVVIQAPTAATLSNSSAAQRPLIVTLDVATDDVLFRNLTIEGGVLAGTGDVGGAVFIRSSVNVGSAHVTFDNVDIQNGVAAYGGGIFAGCGNVRVTLDRTNVLQNGHPTGPASPRSLIGGGVFMSQENAQLEITGGSTISNNRARDMGAGVALFSADPSAGSAALSFSDGIVLNNQLLRGLTETRGAGIAAANTFPNVAVEDAVDAACGSNVFPRAGGAQRLALGADALVSSNGSAATTDSGGGISAEGCSGAVRCWVQAVGAAVRNNDAGLRGAGLSLSGYALTATDNTDISSNHSNGSGGGIFFDGTDQNVTAPCQDSIGSIVVNLSVCIHNSRVTENTAAENGGGLFLTKSNAGRQSVYIMGGAYIGRLDESSDPPGDEGNAANAGGGIYAETCADASTNQTCWLYVGNSARIEANAASNGDGGGIYADDYAVTVDEATLRDNDSSGSGGAIFVTGADGDPFGASMAVEYPGPCFDAASTVPLSLCVLGNAVLSDNTASADGGAISVSRKATVAGNTRARVLASTYSDNAAGDDGGAIAISHTGTQGVARLTVTNALIERNDATRGGGLSFGACPPSNSTCTGEVTGTRVDDNDTVGDGGGVAVTAFNVNFDRLIARGNQAALDGGGLYIGASSTVNLQRAAIAGNQARNGGGVFNGGTLASLENVTLDGNAATTDGGGLANTGAVSTPMHLMTVTENTAADGGGIHTGTEVQIARSLLLSNSSTCSGDVGSTGFNLLPTSTSVDTCNYTGDVTDLTTTYTADQLLGAIAVNATPGASDPLLTRALLFHPAANGAQDNPAVNAAGDCSGDTDARSMPRGGAERGACDIGAYESSLRLDIELTPSTLTPIAGGAAFTLTIDVSMGSNSPAADGVVVRVELPSVVQFGSATALGYTCAFSSGVVTCTRTAQLPESAPDDTLTLSVSIAPNAAPGSMHQVVARLLSTLADSNFANNSDTSTLSPQVIIDLAVTKTDGLTTVVPGSVITYTIVVENDGPSDAAGVEISDVFTGNPNVSLIDWTCTGACATSSGGAGDLSTTTTLPVGQPATYVLRALVNFDSGGETIDNTVNVTAPATYAGNRLATAEDDDTDVSDTTPAAAVVVTKVDTPDPVAAGDVLTYVVTLTNQGPQALRANAISLELGSMGGETTFESFDAPPAWNCDAAPAVGEMGALSPACQSTAVILPGATAEFSAGLRVNDSATGTIAYGATITQKMDGSGGAVTDAPAGETTVVSSTDVGVTLSSAPTSAAPGATFDVTATVTNAGPSPASGATFDVTVPAGLTLTSGAVSLPVLAAAASTSVTLSFSVNADAAEGARTIVANVVHPGDTNASNDSASLAVTIAAEPMGGVTGPTDDEQDLDDEMIVRGGVKGCGCRSTGEGDVLLAAIVLMVLLSSRGGSARRRR